MANIATITNNIISALSGTTSQVLLGDATLTDFKLDSLTDVSVPTPGDGDVLRWNATLSLWEASDAAGITGSGTTNYIAKFTPNGGTLGNSQIFDNGTNVGIGTASPSQTLHVAGNSLIVGGSTWTTGAVATQFFGDIYGSIKYDYNTTNFTINSYGLFSIATNGTSPTTKFTVNANGNVGIGTTTPTYRLDVLGTVAGSAFNALRLFNSTTNTAGTYTELAMPVFNSASGLIIRSYGNSFDAYNAFISTGQSSSSLIFGTGAQVEKMRITPAGFVGIGTTAPAAPLHVVCTTTQGLRLESSSASRWDILSVYNNSNPDLTFSAEGTERLRINATGNVGIGTTTPRQKLDVSGNITTIWGSNVFIGMQYQDGTQYRNGFLLNDATRSTGIIAQVAASDTGATPYIWFATGVTPTERMRLTSGGRLGINTTAPTQTLHIEGTFRAYQDAFNYIIMDGTDLRMSANSAIIIGDNSTDSVTIGAATGETRPTTIKGGPIYFQTTASTRMTIAQDGSLGIKVTPSAWGTGTTGIDFGSGSALWNPGSQFNTLILNNAYNDGTNYIYKGSGASAAYGMQVGNQHIWYQAISGTAGNAITFTQTMTLDANGRLGIGASTPLRKLHVVGDFAVNASGSQYYGVYINGLGEGANPNILIGDWHNASANLTWDSTNRLFRIDTQYSTSGAPIVFSGNDAVIEYMRISAGGNVGIGTSLPAHKLDVNGSQRWIFRNTSSEITDLLVSTESANAISKLSFLWYGNETAAIKFLRGGDATGGSMSFWTQQESSTTTEKVRITSAGTVGIGTTNPTATLHVVGTANITGATTIGGRVIVPSLVAGTSKTSGTGFLDISLSGGVSDTREIGYVFSGAANREMGAKISFIGSGNLSSYQGGYMTFTTTVAGETTVNERMRITADGNVAIGRTNPSYLLDVNGNVRFSGNVIATGNYQMYEGQAIQSLNNGFITIALNSTGWTVNGTLGVTNLSTIGYASSGSSMGLFITNTAASLTSNSSDIWFGNWAGASIGNIYNARISALNTSTGNAATDLLFYTYNGSGASTGVTEKMRITALGEVLIGTTADAGNFKLQVVGSTYLSSNLSVGTTYNGFAANIGGTIYAIGGNVWVQDGYGFANAISPSTGMFPDSTHNITFKNNNATSVYINASGNVGIGTTAPAQRLEVSGAARIGTASAVSGATTIEQTYSGGNVIGVISARYGSGAMLLGYGAKAKNGLDGFISTFSNFTASRAIFEVNQGFFNWYNTSAVATAVGSDLTTSTLMTLSTSGNLGIGTTTPLQKLDVNGDALINGIRVGKGPNSLSGNTVLGASGLNGITTGTNNVAIGQNALDGTTTGSYNIAIGFFAGGIGATENSTGSLNIFIGAEAQGISSTESNRTWIGSNTTTATWLGGNLLLGTRTNSTYRLDVVGTGRISNGLYVSGGLVAIQTLAGSGTAIVVTDNAGNLSTQPTTTYLSSLSGEATNSGNVVTLTNSAVIDKVLTGLNVNSASITASDSILSAFGKIQGQIDGLQGGTIYKGSWNASTNTPTITSSTGTQGNYYVVTTAGTTNINGVSSWAVGDWIIFNGSVWEKIPNVDAITSVNGQTGVVSLTTSNINEGTNLYYTDARARGAISLTTSGSSGASTYSSGVLNIPTYTLAGLGGASSGTTITINGVAQDLSTNRTYSVGTVTSIGLAVPTGFTATSAITSSGDITLGFASGYSLPTTASQTNWDTAYNRSATALAYNGSTGVVTLTKQDTTTLTATITLGPFTTGNLTEGSNLYYTDARARAAITLTTSGTSGAATYSSGVLNIPQYQSVLTNPVTGTGTAGHIAFFNGATSITGESNLFWDATNNRLGINNALPSYSLHVTGNGYFSDSVRMPNNKALTFEQTGGSILGGISMTVNNAVTLSNNSLLGVMVYDDQVMLSGKVGIGHAGNIYGGASTALSMVNSLTTPSSSFGDSFIMYSSDVTAGNAAPHFRTENGAVIKLYRETTAVGNSIFLQGGGNSVLDDSTFDGYTLRQIVKALRNQGILQ